MHKTNEECDGGMKHMWVGVKGILGKQTAQPDTGIATPRAQSVKTFSSLEGREKYYL